MQPTDFMTDSLRRIKEGKDIAAILNAAIEAVDPYQATLRQLRLGGNQLHIGRQTYNLRKNRRIFLVGAGKAGLPMTQAVIEKLGYWIAGGVVIVKEGYGGPSEIGGVQIVEAGHPIPDQRGLSATKEMLALLDGTQPEDIVLVVISGGGSALLTSPVAGITLEDLQIMNTQLLASGADIEEINRLRKQLDTVKGGGLAQAAAPAPVAALILSDVVGDPLEYIASGPTVPLSSRWQSVLDVVEKYQLRSRLPEAVVKALHRPPRPPLVTSAAPNNLLIGNNETAAQGAISHAERVGFKAHLLTTTMQGEAREVGMQMASRLREFARLDSPRPAMWVAGGETTVTLQGNGIGGRNQELALATVQELAGVKDAVLVTLATDGGDGRTDAAGAVVTGETSQRAQSLGLDAAQFLANNDSYTFFTKLGDCLIPGPTRTNVNDLLFLFLL